MTYMYKEGKNRTQHAETRLPRTDLRVVDTHEVELFGRHFVFPDKVDALDERNRVELEFLGELFQLEPVNLVGMSVKRLHLGERLFAEQTQNVRVFALVPIIVVVEIVVKLVAIIVVIVVVDDAVEQRRR